MVRLYVVCMNDYPEYICEPGTTEAQAREMAAMTKAEYLRLNTQVKAYHVNTHVQFVPVRTHKETIG